MPINASGMWTNYTFSNCVMNQTTHNFTTVPLAQLNMSGMMCTIVVNFPWFFPVLLIVMYVVIAFLFSYLQSTRLLTVATALGFGFASILWGYGLIGQLTWFFTFGALLLSLFVAYLVHRG